MDYSIENYLETSKVRVSKICLTIQTISVPTITKAKEKTKLQLMLDILNLELQIISNSVNHHKFKEKEEFIEYLKFLEQRHFTFTVVTLSNFKFKIASYSSQVKLKKLIQ